MEFELRNLYFQRSNGEFVLLSADVTEDNAVLKMSEFLKEHNFKSYYTRIWEKNGVKWFDVGSHTEFFVWASAENLNKMIKEEE